MDFDQAIWKDPNFLESSAFIRCDEAIARNAANPAKEQEVVRRFSVPYMNVARALGRRDEAAFQAALVEGLQGHKAHWTSKKQLREELDGMVSLKLTALAALAWDRGLRFKVDSGYLPWPWVTGELFRESEGREATSKHRRGCALALPELGGDPMSAGMQVYLVDEAEVRSIHGCDDTELLEHMLQREGQRDSLESFDEAVGDLMEDDCPDFTHADALREIFAGEVSRPEVGYVYTNAFEFVCSYLGEWVHDQFHRCDAKLLQRLDELFAAHGIALRFWGGLIANPPVPLPEDYDGTLLGYWTAEQILTAAPAFRAMMATRPEPELIPLLEEVAAWIQMIEQQQGNMLVGAYS